MKIFKWISDNALFLITLFLLAFIPLYPKLPLLDIQNTWVYIRAEDIIVALTFMFWIILMLSKKITFKTPLTMPIMLFWIIGAISTLHGILLIFPTLGSIFPNVAFLNYLRRIEYLSLFFIAYSSIKDKRVIPYVVVVISVTLLLVALYGIGQKYLGLPAYLTMNEEFAKGIPIRLSPLSRVSSTFGGHYDLAAYLVLIIPILSSMVFGFRNWFMKLSLLAPISLGIIVLFMTVSRVSFAVLLLSMAMVFILQKKRFAIYAMVAFFFIGIIFLSFSTSMLERFGNTVKEVNVLVDTTRGEPIGHVQQVPSQNFKDKIIKIKFAQSKSEIDAAIGGKEDIEDATNSALIVSVLNLPPSVPFVVEANKPNGESLPQGTGYINLALAPIIAKEGRFFYQKSDETKALGSEEIFAIQGNFLIKKVLAYDLSFTTRFQGE